MLTACVSLGLQAGQTRHQQQLQTDKANETESVMHLSTAGVMSSKAVDEKKKKAQNENVDLLHRKDIYIYIYGGRAEREDRKGIKECLPLYRSSRV